MIFENEINNFVDNFNNNNINIIKLFNNQTNSICELYKNKQKKDYMINIINYFNNNIEANKLYNQYKILAKKYIDGYMNIIQKYNIKKIYCGQTEKTVEERLNEHKKKNKNFNDMEAIGLFESSNPVLINDLEEYLINKFNIIFNNNKDIVLNRRKKNGELIQTGGNGQNPQYGDIFTLYIIINK